MTKGDRVGSDGRFRYGNSMDQGECPLCLVKGHFPLSADSGLSFLGIQWNSSICIPV